MLKTILSVSGKPGLFKLISSAKNMVIVQSLADGKKVPIHSRDRVVSLGDISIYTEDGNEVPLKDVLLGIKNKENGNKASIQAGAKPDELSKYFVEVLPNYDKERVYTNDMKKMISWYNLLTNANVDFEKVEEEAKEVADNKE